MEWKRDRATEERELREQGIIPFAADMKSGRIKGAERFKVAPLLMGQVAGVIDTVLPADEIVREMVEGARDCVNRMVKSMPRGSTGIGAKL